MPTQGYTTVDPKLTKDRTGTYHLQKGSPAVDKAKGSYPAITVDIDGQKRKGILDVGADEVTGERIANRLLSAADVGNEAVGVALK